MAAGALTVAVRPASLVLPMTPGDGGWRTRLAAWAAGTVPSREQLEQNRLLHPFARRPGLWRFTRRSVPRGVAIGLFVGIFAMIPGIQIIAAALMCVPFRGNVPLAAAMTFLSNPATTPLILAASIWVGDRFGFHADLSTFFHLYRSGARLAEWTHWLVSDAAPALLVGLIVISIVAAALGYVIAAWVWRRRVLRKWRARPRSRARG